jgi:hypothetical protein
MLCEEAFARKDSEKPIIDRILDNPQGVLTMDLEFVYLRSQELWHDFSSHDIHSELERLLLFIRKRAINDRLTKLAYDIKTAEHAHDKERLEVLLVEFTTTSRQLNS